MKEVTDDQVRDLYRDGLIHVDVVDLAMFGTPEERTEARAICADILLKVQSDAEFHETCAQADNDLSQQISDQSDEDFDAEEYNRACAAKTLQEDELVADDLANGESYEDCP